MGASGAPRSALLALVYNKTEKFSDPETIVTFSIQVQTFLFTNVNPTKVTI